MPSADLRPKEFQWLAAIANAWEENTCRLLDNTLRSGDGVPARRRRSSG